MLNFQNVPVLLNGVDTKGDVKNGQVGTYADIQNLWMQKTGALKIRNGTGSPQGGSGTHIAEFKDSLLTISNTRTFLTATNSSFHGLNALRIQHERPANAGSVVYVNSDSVNIVTRGFVATQSPITYQQYSKTTLTPIDFSASPVSVTAGAGHIFSGSNAGAAYTETNTLKVTIFQTATTSTLRADASTNQIYAFSRQDSSAAVCVSCNIARNEIRIDAFTASSGALVETKTIAAVGEITGRPYVIDDPNTSPDVLVCWSEKTGANTMDHVIYRVSLFTGSTLGTPALVSRRGITGVTFGGIAEGNAFCAISGGSTIIAGMYIPTGGQLRFGNSFRQYSYTNVELVGNPFNVNNTVYIPVCDRTMGFKIPETTTFLGSVTAIVLGAINTVNVDPIQTPVTLLKGSYLFTSGTFVDRFLASNVSTDNRVFTVNEVVNFKIENGVVVSTTRPVIVKASAGVSKNIVTTGGRIYAAIASNVVTFDGLRWLQTNIDEAPTISASAAGAAGTLAAGDYLVSAVYTYTDALGMLHRSPPSSPIKITAVLNNQITVTVPQGGTLLSTVNVELYISEVNTGTLFLHSVAPRTTASRVISSVANISTSTPLYAQGGIIEATSSPVCSTVAVGKNRLWAGSVQDGKLYYTKEFTPSEAPSWNEAFSLPLSGEGDIVAIAEMDDKIIVSKSSNTSVLYGQGTDETGAGGFGNQLISSDIGAVNDAGFCLCEEGVICFSSKGVYLITKDIQSVYFGAPVEDTVSGTSPVGNYSDATSERTKIVLANGKTIVRDSYHKIWTVDVYPFTLVHCADVNGVLSLLAPDGTRQELNAGTDNGTAIPVIVKSKWVPLSGLEGFARIKEFRGVGTLLNAHTLTLKWGVDYETSVQTFTLTSGTYAADGNMKFEARPAKQKCAAFQFELSASVTNNPFTLTGFSILAGQKMGSDKLPASRRGI